MIDKPIHGYLLKDGTILFIYSQENTRMGFFPTVLEEYLANFNNRPVLI